MGRRKKKQRSQGTHENKFIIKDGVPKVGKKQKLKARGSYVPKGGERKDESYGYESPFQSVTERKTQSVGYSFMPESSIEGDYLDESDNFTIRKVPAMGSRKDYKIKGKEYKNTLIESIEVSFSSFDADHFYNVRYQSGIRQFYSKLPPKRIKLSSASSERNKRILNEMEEINGLIEKVKN